MTYPGVGFERDHLIAVKKAIRRRIRNQYQLKMNEIMMLSPSLRAPQVEELGQLPPFDDIAVVARAAIHKFRDDAEHLLRAVKDTLGGAQEATIRWIREPGGAPPGRRVECAEESVAAYAQLFSDCRHDAAGCGTLCEVGRRWAEPYWSPKFDATDAELLEERRDMLVRHGIETFAAETLEKFRDHHVLGSRVTLHAAHLLAALNVKLFMLVAKTNDARLVCEATLSAMMQRVKEGRADELALYGARNLLVAYESRFGTHPNIRLRLGTVHKALRQSPVQDIEMSTFQTDWPLEDVEMARTLFGSLSDSDGFIETDKLKQLFRTMAG